MNTENEIKQVETELQELLHRVLQAPLEPITRSVEYLGKRLNGLDELTEKVEELRDEDLAVLLKTEEWQKSNNSLTSLIKEIHSDVRDNILTHLGLILKTEEWKKNNDSLTSLIEEIPSDVQEKIKILLVKELGQLQKVQQSALEKTHTHLVTHVDAVQNRIDENSTELMTTLDLSNTKLSTLLMEQHAQIFQLQHQNAALTAQFEEKFAQSLTHFGLLLKTEEWEKSNNSLTSLIEEIPSDVQDKIKPLLARELDEFQRVQQSELEKTKTYLMQCVDAAQNQINDNTNELVTKLAVSNEKLRSILMVQHEKILQLQQQNTTWTTQFEEKFSKSITPLKHWLITTTTLAGVAVIGIGMLTARQFLG